MRALELARQGHWDEAHRLVQASSDTLSCLVHGYLHRLEGDLGNAGYWYARAGERLPGNALDEEWRRLAELAATG
jgi:hypothetical protein